MWLKENLRHLFFGTGLGSHETAFKKFTLTKTLLPYDLEFNIKDGNSLFIRLCTETGLTRVRIYIFSLSKRIYIQSRYSKRTYVKA